MERRVSVSQACKLTGKSESTIKRMVREVVGDPAHPDRGFIEPSHEEVERRKVEGEPYVWKIDTELLLKRFPPEDALASPATAESPAVAPNTGLLVSVLQEQLQSKDEQLRTLEKQLDRKDEQIANLNERQRETNILMKELQQKLSIAPPREDTAGKTPWWKRRLF